VTTPRATFLTRIALVGGFAVAVRTAFVLVVTRNVGLGIDSVWYMLVGGQIANGDGYISPGAFLAEGVRVPTAGWPPGYPALLAAVTWVAQSTPTTFRVAGALAGAGCAVLIGLVARRIAGDRAALLAVALATVHPLLMAVDGAVMSETLYMPLTVVALLLAFRALSTPTPLRWAALGAVLGMAVLTRVDALVLTPVLVAATALATDACWRRRAGLSLVALAAVAAVTLPWVVRNDRAIGQPVLSSNSGPTWAGANCTATYFTRRIGHWVDSCIAPQGRLTEAEWSRRNQEQGVEFARHHRKRVPKVVGVRVLRVWGLWDPIEQARYEAIESRQFGWQVAGWAYYLVLAVVAVPSAVALVRRRARIAAPLAAVLLAVTLTAVVSHGNQRFRLGAEPVLVALAAATLTGLPRRLRRGGTVPT
jgi:4-amino-4-deoxy-L-arabinose transferase-like glycosyltransferase